ncbi:hypothetical protein PILCRDRAFT_717976 [Piloderma croceum F 1598]|uniref:Uncharacterized protein n=1 Tax=Piloderma croceum (strain F 1598) TaxID=765440 RepID=A0A0C3B940_PILCF|nr:hypothetical protein PILCRDRAFT_717976 [Piloderma croceum F 1598]
MWPVRKQSMEAGQVTAGKDSGSKKGNFQRGRGDIPQMKPLQVTVVSYTNFVTCKSIKYYSDHRATSSHDPGHIHGKTDASRNRRFYILHNEQSNKLDHTEDPSNQTSQQHTHYRHICLALTHLSNLHCGFAVSRMFNKTGR